MEAKKLAQPRKKPYSTPSTSNLDSVPLGGSKRNANGRKRALPSSGEMNGEKVVVVMVDDKDSSSSGSSDSGSSSSGEESSSSSSVESTSKPSSFWNEDELGGYIDVTCAGNEAKFYKNRFARGSIGRCVQFKGRWITPNEFQAISGRQSSKDWKRSIRLDGRCLKEFISDGLFREHAKTCPCDICLGGMGPKEDEDLRRQEGVIALAAKRRRLSQAGIDGSHGSSGPSHTTTPLQHPVSGIEGGAAVGAESGDSEQTESTMEKKLPGSGVKRNKRGRPPKNQRVWSPSGEVAEEVSSNEDEHHPKNHGPQPDDEAADPVIDVSDYLPRRSRRAHSKQTGYRTELGTYTRRPIDWDTEEVAEFMKLQGFAGYADAFQEYDINGQSMFLLREHHLLERFTMKLGPTLRLLDTIARLRHPPLV